MFAVCQYQECYSLRIVTGITSPIPCVGFRTFARMTGLKPCEGSETYARVTHQFWGRYFVSDPNAMLSSENRISMGKSVNDLFSVIS